MNIEVAPEEYYIKCSYDEAMMYCFQLEIDSKTGWRLPTNNELFQNIYNGIYARYDQPTWSILDSECVGVARCVPVRDIL